MQKKRKIRRTPYRLRSRRNRNMPGLRSVITLYAIALFQFGLAAKLTHTWQDGRWVPSENPPLNLIMFLIGSGSFCAGVRVPFKELSELAAAIKK